MRNAEEFPGQRSGLARVRPAYRRPRPGAGGRPGDGRIRYAHTGALPRDEAFCTVPQRPAGYHGSEAGTEDVADLGDLGHLGDLGDLGHLGDHGDHGDHGDGGKGGDGGDGGDSGSDDLGGGIWLTEFPVGSRRTDLWVLVCGGIATAAAFAAAFLASGGAATHPASPGAAVPGIVSQAACPSPAAVPAP